MDKSVVTQVFLPFPRTIRIHRTTKHGREKSTTYSRLTQKRAFLICEICNRAVENDNARTMLLPEGWMCTILGSYGK